jgi:pimeloyl-[acyl-carrier protein] synthase
MTRKLQRMGERLSMEDAVNPRHFDFQDPAFFDDPYPIYRRLRSEDPVHRDNYLGVWVLTTYGHVEAALSDERLSANWIIPLGDRVRWPVRAVMRSMFRRVSEVVVFMDQPDHTRLRGLMNKAFTPRVVDGLRSHIQHIVDELLDSMGNRGYMDVIHDFASPLPVTVIAETLGAPPAHRPILKRCSDDFAAAFGTPRPHTMSLIRGAYSLWRIERYFRGLIADHHTRPRDDLLQALMSAEEEGHRLTEEELLVNCANLVFAGHETTTNLIGSGMLALLRNPDRLEELKADSSLLGAAADEFLRYESPVQFTRRVAIQDVEFGGVAIGKGQTIMIGLAAANRDPAQFPDPDRLDFHRAENRHLAFGHGGHFCLGSPLARLEATLAIGTILRRWPNLRLATDRVSWNENFALRGLKSLPVVLA